MRGVHRAHVSPIDRVGHITRVALVVLVSVWSFTACGDADAGRRRVLVLGIDGMDYRLTRRLIGEGKLPNLARLEQAGGFQPLETSIPPQSPVAWSDFITGLDAGGHGIFDFIHRKPETLEPYLSTSQVEAPGRQLRLGGWQIPLGGGGPILLRRGVPFWEVLEDKGIPTTIVRMPANFPPSGSASRELSGMGTPDILGSYGTFSFFTTAPERIEREITGGHVYPAKVTGNVFRGRLTGPPNPFLVEGKALTAEFAVYVDPARSVAKIELGDEELILAEGEWSEWVRVEFEPIPWLQTLSGIVRFYLKEVDPEFELYVSPINIDPLAPAMPISTPPEFAVELAEAAGRYYTQGMPEDTKALVSGILDEEAFLGQAQLVAEEQRAQYEFLLDRFDGGLLFYYFGFIDQVSHVMWHAMDAGHPAHDSVRDSPFRHVIEDLYVQADEIVGTALERLDPDETLIVMSDHGFTSWRRAFNLNTWLAENGYLAVRDVSRQGELPFLQNVDWSRTRAYGLGLSGLYLNLRGRERAGRVPRTRYRRLCEEIAERLLQVRDPATGRPVITKVYIRDETYSDGGLRDVGPDLVIGYARGVRASDETAEGRVPRELFADNADKWSGDHIMDHEEVPGVLFTNRTLKRPVQSLNELAAAVLLEFGIEGFPPEPRTSSHE